MSERIRITRREIDRLAAGTIVHATTKTIGVRVLYRAGEAARQINDTEIPGFAARLLPSGRVQYLLRYQRGGQRRFMALGLDGEVTPEDARKLAARRRVEFRGGGDPAAAAQLEARRAAETVETMGDLYLEREAKPRLRSAHEIERQFKAYINPAIGRVAMLDLRRRHIAALLDTIETKNGAVMADRVLATVRRLCNWYAARVDDFSPPIVRGMARTRPRERARDRVLSPDEIRKIWAALPTAKPAIVGPFVTMLFYTAARRGEVAGAEWREIAGGTWRTPGAKYKTKRENVLPLSAPALLVLAGLKRRRRYVFSTDGGKTPFSGFSKAKRALDRKAKVKGWTWHDIRRTCRSLMAAAGVAPDIAERVLGHVIPGVGGVYNRHDYAAEKAAALKALADAIDNIVGAGAAPTPNAAFGADPRPAVPAGTASSRR